MRTIDCSESYVAWHLAIGTFLLETHFYFLLLLKLVSCKYDMMALDRSRQAKLEDSVPSRFRSLISGRQVRTTSAVYVHAQVGIAGLMTSCVHAEA